MEQGEDAGVRVSRQGRENGVGQGFEAWREVRHVGVMQHMRCLGQEPVPAGDGVGGDGVRHA